MPPVQRFHLKPIAPLLLALCLSGCDDTGSSRQSATNSVASIIERADNYREQGQFRAGVIEVNKALQTDPDNTDALITLAKIQLHVGGARSAISTLESIDPPPYSSPEYTLTLATAYMERGKFFSADEVLGKNEQLKETNPFRYHLLSASISMGLNDFERAEQALNKSLEYATDNTQQRIDVYREFIRLSMRQGMQDKAQTYIAKASELGKFPEILLQQGAIAYENRQLDAAEDYLSAALLELKNTDMITPLRAEVLRGLIQTLSISGRSSEALIYSKLLSDANPDASEKRAQINEALDLYKAGDLVAAEEQLLSVYTQSRNEFSGRLLGLINAQQGDFSEADLFLTETVDPETATGRAVSILAETKLKLNQTQEALDILEARVTQEPNNPDLLTVYGLSLLNASEPEKAIINLKKAIELGVSKPLLKLALAEAYFKTRNNDEAEKQLLETYSSNKSDPQIQSILSRFYMVSGQLDKAKQQAAAGLKAAPKLAFSHRLAGTVSLAAKEYNNARRHFENALRINKNDVSAVLGLSQTDMITGNTDRAIKRLEVQIANNANVPPLYKAFIAAYDKKGSVQTAIKQIHTLGTEKAALWAPFGVLAEYYAINGNQERAYEYMSKALKRNSSPYLVNQSISILYNYAIASFRAGRYTEAREAIWQALQNKPNNSDFLTLLTSLELQNGNINEARKLIAQIAEKAPHSPLVIELEGDLLIAKQDYKGALKQYYTAWEKRPADALGGKIVRTLVSLKNPTAEFITQWRQRLPRSEQPLLAQAIVHKGANEPRKAIARYEEALALNPDSLEALNNMAWIKFTLQDDDAESIAERAARLYPSNPLVLDTYGWILYHNKRYKIAQEVLARASKLAPENDDIRQHLATAEQALGKKAAKTP